MATRGFLAAVKEYFGMLPEYKGQAGIKGFALEIKALTEKDRIEIGAMLSAEVGVELTDVIKQQ